MNRSQLPESLEMISKSEVFSSSRHRWNTNEEIASILIGFDKHEEWLSKEVEIRPRSGSLLLYSRKRVRYRRDGYCWKKRKDGKTTREDHMKLKVQGTECIYGCYVHSAILPTFHRRCYWLLHNPDIVLVHYLNVPFTDDNKIITPTLTSIDCRKDWSMEELISELKPMFYMDGDNESFFESEISRNGSIEAAIQHLMTRQRAKVRAAEDSTVDHNNSGMRKSSLTENVTGETGMNEMASGEDCSISKQNISTGRTSFTSSSAKTTPVVTTTVNSTPLIFNLSQLRSGTNSILIFNSSLPVSNANFNANSLTQRANGSCTTPAPITVLCNRTSSGSFSLPTNGMSDEINSNLVNVTQSSGKPFKSDDLTTGLSNIEALNGNSVTIESETMHQQRQQQQPLFESGLDAKREDNHLQLRHMSSNCHRNTDNTSSHTAVSSSSQQINSLHLLNQNQTSTDRSDSFESLEHDSNAMDTLENDFASPDEEFFNLETFDMLTDHFPALDDLSCLNPSATRSEMDQSNNNSITNTGATGDDLRQTAQEPDATPRITDYSPEWSYPEGGMKVLVAGPWSSLNANYSTFFDGIAVPTSLIQKGVLRCFAPAHEPGFVGLQVAIDGIPVSNSVIFEYREAHDTPTAVSTNYFNVDDNVFKFCLMERLELLESHVSTGARVSSPKASGNTFERWLISSYKLVMSSPWLPCDVTAVTSQSLRSGSSLTDMSLIHLAAALGYSDLIQQLIYWHKENPSIILEVEVDAFSRDKNDCTPLMWSLARGHRDASILLLRWNRGAINLCNKQGISPLYVARRNGHNRLADEIEQLQRDLLAAPDSLELYRVTSQRSTTGITEKGNGRVISPNVTVSTRKIHSYPNRIQLVCHTRSSRRQYRRRSLIPSVCSHNNKNTDAECDSEAESSGESSDEDVDSVTTSGNCSCSGFSSNRSSFDGNEIRSGGAGEELLDTNEQVLSFAEHIIAAIPDHIKVESDEDAVLSELSSDPDMDRMRAHYSSSFQGLLPERRRGEDEIPFRLSSYRSQATPASSPASSSCLQSPGSMNLESPSPSTDDLCEFFGSGRLIQKEFSSLTLSEREQRELYDAAKTIQSAFRVYKDRKSLEQEKEKEKHAAILIQSYYRRYKQYVYYKQMTKAAQVIQSQYRSYCSKRFKKSTSRSDASCVNGCISRPDATSCNSPQLCFPLTRDQLDLSVCGTKRSYSQRREQQAARQIQQFLLKTKNNPRNPQETKGTNNKIPDYKHSIPTVHAATSSRITQPAGVR